MTNTLMSENKRVELIEAVNAVAEAIVELFNKIKEVVVRTFNYLVEVFREVLKKADPKVFNLAYSHPKRRVRKKNFARLMRMLRC